MTHREPSCFGRIITHVIHRQAQGYVVNPGATSSELQHQLPFFLGKIANHLLEEFPGFIFFVWFRNREQRLRAELCVPKCEFRRLVTGQIMQQKVPGNHPDTQEHCLVDETVFVEVFLQIQLCEPLSFGFIDFDVRAIRAQFHFRAVTEVGDKGALVVPIQDGAHELVSVDVDVLEVVHDDWLIVKLFPEKGIQVYGQVEVLIVERGSDHDADVFEPFQLFQICGRHDLVAAEVGVGKHIGCGLQKVLRNTRANAIHNVTVGTTSIIRVFTLQSDLEEGALKIAAKNRLDSFDRL